MDPEQAQLIIRQYQQWLADAQLQVATLSADLALQARPAPSGQQDQPRTG